MQTITLNGKEYKLAFNLAAGIAFEQITGNPITNLKQFATGHIAPLVALGYAMLFANNKTEEVPEFEEWTRTLDFGPETTDFFNAINAELTTYFKPSKSEQKPDKKGKKSKKEEKEEESSKNS